jgi:hypothetical protein
MMKLLLPIFLVFTLSACAPSKSNYAMPTEPLEEIRTVKDTFKYFTLTDTNIALYRLPKQFVKPLKWLQADTNWNARFSLGYRQAYPSTYDLKQALAMIDTAKEFDHILMAKTWCVDHYAEAFPHLIQRLGFKQKIGLVNSADLIIVDRLNTGDMKFYGHGGSVYEDLFTPAGRASYILNSITGETFAVVNGDLGVSEALEYKRLWVEYVNEKL